MISSAYSHVLIDKVTFHANEGGVIEAGSSDVVFNNCLIWENKEVSWGQISLNNSQGVISNCIIYKNIEWRPVITLYTADIQILNTIIWENGNNVFNIGYQSHVTACYSNIQGGYDGTREYECGSGFCKCCCG